MHTLIYLMAIWRKFTPRESALYLFHKSERRNELHLRLQAKYARKAAQNGELASEWARKRESARANLLAAFAQDKTK